MSFHRWGVLLFLGAICLRAETGYDAWLRYAFIDDPNVRQTYAQLPATIVTLDPTTVVLTAAQEANRGVRGMLDATSPDDHAVLDADEGQLILRPETDVRELYTRAVQARSLMQAGWTALRDRPAVTRDHVPVSLMLNVGLSLELAGELPADSSEPESTRFRIHPLLIEVVRRRLVAGGVDVAQAQGTILRAVRLDLASGEIDRAFQERLDGASLSNRHGLHAGQPVDKKPIALVGGHPACAGVRLHDVALFFQGCHVITHGGGRDAELATLRHSS